MAVRVVREFVTEHQRQVVVLIQEVDHPSSDEHSLAVGKGVQLGRQLDANAIVASDLWPQREDVALGTALHHDPNGTVLAKLVPNRLLRARDCAPGGSHCGRPDFQNPVALSQPRAVGRPPGQDARHPDTVCAPEHAGRRGPEFARERLHRVQPHAQHDRRVPFAQLCVRHLDSGPHRAHATRVVQKVGHKGLALAFGLGLGNARVDLGELELGARATAEPDRQQAANNLNRSSHRAGLSAPKRRHSMRNCRRVASRSAGLSEWFHAGSFWYSPPLSLAACPAGPSVSCSNPFVARPVHGSFAGS